MLGQGQLMLQRSVIITVLGDEYCHGTALGYVSLRGITGAGASGRAYDAGTEGLRAEAT
jgi:hypothetical protein